MRPFNYSQGRMLRIKYYDGGQVDVCALHFKVNRLHRQMNEAMGIENRAIAGFSLLDSGQCFVCYFAEENRLSQAETLERENSFPHKKGKESMAFSAGKRNTEKCAIASNGALFGEWPK